MKSIKLAGDEGDEETLEVTVWRDALVMWIGQLVSPSVRPMSLKIKIGNFDCKGNTMEFSESFVCQSLTHTHSFAGNFCKTYFRSCEILKLTPPPPLAPSPHLFFTPKLSSHQSLCFCSIHATPVFVYVCLCEILHPTPLNTDIVYRQWNPGNNWSKSYLNSIIFILL